MAEAERRDGGRGDGEEEEDEEQIDDSVGIFS
jgi:hypothetical protein